MKKYKTLIIILAILATLVGGYFLYERLNDQTPVEDPTSVAPAKQEARDQDTVDETENTDSDNDSPEEPKKSDEDDSDEQEPTNLPKPRITFAGFNNGKYLVKASVPYDSKGACVLNLTANGTTKTYTSESFHQPGYQQCETFVFEEDELEKGTWTAKIRFELNNKVSEYSDEKTFEVK